MEMQDNSDAEIESCLAYEVLRNPNDWIGCPSTEFLAAFLAGAQIRADCMQPDYPSWKINGVLDIPGFYKTFVDATGHPALTIKWAGALAMTHFSLEDGFETLRVEALGWHRKKGIADTRRPSPSLASSCSALDTDKFWRSFARRPGMYAGDNSGWMLFCFLNGMEQGGDWLRLPMMPRLCEIFDGIKKSSEKSYGSSFAAFRVYDARGLLAWVDLLPDEDETVV